MTSSKPSPGPGARRLLGCVTLGYGTALGLYGTKIATRTGVGRAVVRVLAVRYAVQGIAVLTGGPDWARLAALADATHAVSMLPVAAWKRYRVAALTSATAAAGLARASWWAAG